MKKSVTTLVAGVTIALTSSLVFVFPTVQASAAAAPSAACVKATATMNKAKKAKKKAVTQVKKAKKANAKAKKVLKKKRTKATVKKVKLTKKRLVKANKTLKVRTKRVKVTTSARTAACKVKPTSPIVVPPKSPEAQALSQVLNLILQGMGGKGTDISLLGKDGVKGLLNSTAPGLGDLISDDLLGNIVAMLSNPLTTPLEAAKKFSDVFGQFLDPAALAALANGSLNPADAAGLFKSMFAGLIGEFAPAGFKIPEFSPAAVTGLISQLVSMANPGALQGMGLGAFEDIFKGMVSGDMTGMLKPSQLTNLVNLLNPSQLADLKGLGILPMVIGGLTDGAGGLPGLASLPVLGPVLDGVLDTLKKLLCGLLAPLC